MDAHIEGVRFAESPSGVVAVVTIAVDGESDVLPIFVGFEEAASIARGLDAVDIGRPLTHDLLLDVVEELGGRVDRVAISDIDDGTYIVAETVADIIDHEEVLLRHNEIESRMFFVACVTDDVVGWVHIAHPEVDKLSHTAELTVGVLEEYRQHGIGSHLLGRGVEWAATNGYERLYNSVPSTNEAAIAFLEGQGWEIEAVREDHYKIDDEYVDEVMMARQLD